MRRLLPAIIFFLILIYLLISFISRTPEEARIRKNLRKIENLLTTTTDEAAAAALIRANRAAEYFTEDCRIRANGFNINGREELSAVIHSTRRIAGSVQVRFRDISIRLKDEKTAEALLTAAATAQGETVVREVKLKLVKQAGSWKIKQAETVEILR